MTERGVGRGLHSSAGRLEGRPRVPGMAMTAVGDVAHCTASWLASYVERPGLLQFYSPQGRYTSKSTTGQTKTQ